ncbi:hypothetical protein V1514DRAFT_148623 [Lipomyces japonicus]|uniref:uncharacterized protein n=1 Tax=Lipomyces japonicus TaxID=56871 RepID=UPI0034CED06B
MSSQPNPNARPFSPRHRPPPIKISPPPGIDTSHVQFAPIPVNLSSRASLLSGLRTSRTPDSSQPGEYSSNPQPTHHWKYPHSPYVVPNISSPSTPSDDDISGFTQGAEESVDPNVYAALQSRQQDLMATSLLIAHQQEQIQQAMFNTAYQQQQQQQLPLQVNYDGNQYYQDGEGNVWLISSNPYVQPQLVQQANHVFAQSARRGSPRARGTGGLHYDSENSQFQNTNSSPSNRGLYNLGNGSAPSLLRKQRKGHRKTSSLDASRVSASATLNSPSNQYDDYQITEVTTGLVLSSSSSKQFAPVRQPVIPIPSADLKKNEFQHLNFYATEISRLYRKQRRNPIVSNKILQCQV